jgi:hypothetical protein
MEIKFIPEIGSPSINKADMYIDKRVSLYVFGMETKPPVSILINLK